MAELLRFEHVEISYGVESVVHDVSLRCSPGKFWAWWGNPAAENPR